MVKFSLKNLDSDRKYFKTFVSLAVYWPFYYTTQTSKFSNFLNRASTMLNNVNNALLSLLWEFQHAWCTRMFSHDLCINPLYLLTPGISKWVIFRNKFLAQFIDTHKAVFAFVIIPIKYFWRQSPQFQSEPGATIFYPHSPCKKSYRTIRVFRLLLISIWIYLNTYPCI